MRSLLQIVRGGVRTCRTASATSLQREIKFRAAEFHIVAPFGFGIETKRNYREQISAGRSIRQIKNVLRRTQALVRVNGVTGLVLVIADSQRSRHAASKVGADQCARLNLVGSIHCSRVDENRAVANVS